MDIDELLSQVPPAARYRRQPLPDSQNALSYWSEAAETMTPLSADLWARCSAAETDEWAVGGSSRPFKLDETTTEALREIVSRNELTLTLLDQGVACGRVQFPEFSDEGGSIQEHDDAMKLMRTRHSRTPNFAMGFLARSPGG